MDLGLDLSPLRRGVFRHFREVLLLVGAYFVYMFMRRFALPGVEEEAFANAVKVISFETAAGIFWEPYLQDIAMKSSRALVVFFNWAYIFTFLPVIITTAVIVYFKDRPKYLYYRNLVLLSFVFALIIFVAFPLAPPRFVPEHGFIDAIQRFGPTWYGKREVDFYYNAFAAMPSLHFGWSVLFGVMLFRTRQRWLMAAGAAYPVVTLFAITITGNHYIIDAVGGTIMILGTFVFYEGLRRWRYRVYDGIRDRALALGGSARGLSARVGRRGLLHVRPSRWSWRHGSRDTWSSHVEDRTGFSRKPADHRSSR